MSKVMETRSLPQRRNDAITGMLQFQKSPVFFPEDDDMTDPMSATSTQMANLLFPDRASTTRARRIFDKVRASDQCKGVNIPISTECWLCSTKLDHTVKYPNPLAPQCDHILPVIQGIMFLELYGRRYEDITPAMEKEYAWAHAVCNNLKSNSVLIKVNPDGTYGTDDLSIDNLLDKITQKGIRLDKKQCKTNIKTKLAPIIEYLTKDGVPGIHDLNVLAGVISIIEKSGAGGRRKRTKRNKRRRYTRRR
jgi:hypothetical protein